MRKLLLPFIFLLFPSFILSLPHTINQSKKALAAVNTAQDQLIKKIQHNEKQLMTLDNRLEHSEQTLLKRSQLLKTLNHQLTRFEKHLTQEKADITQILKASYIVYRQHAMDRNLELYSLTTVPRMLYYYQTIQSHQLTHLASLKQRLEKLQKDQHWVSFLKKRTLKKQQHNQTKAEKIKQDIRLKKKKLASLMASRHQLESLIKHLKEEQATRNAHPLSKHSKLIWPMKGKVIHHFNDAIESSKMRWNALVIKGKPGQSVYATATGKVVFAHYLKRYGLLLIIHHGNQYLSLYGQNETLYRHVGDTVAAGDLVARVDKKKARLFFGLWHQGKPIDPEQFGNFVNK